MKSLDGRNCPRQPLTSNSPGHRDLPCPHLKKILQQIPAGQGLQEGASLPGSTFIHCLLCTNTVHILGTFSNIADHGPCPGGFARLTIEVLQTNVLANRKRRKKKLECSLRLLVS